MHAIHYIQVVRINLEYRNARECGKQVFVYVSLVSFVQVVEIQKLRGEKKKKSIVPLQLVLYARAKEINLVFLFVQPVFTDRKNTRT